MERNLKTKKDKTLKSCHLISGLTAAGGGVFEFTRGLCTSLQNSGVSTEIMGFGNDDEDVSGLWNPCNAVKLRSLGPRSLRFPHQLTDSLRQSKPDVAHIHGLWSGFSATVPRTATRLNIPYIVSPHGMLEPWAWNHHAWKKRPIWWLWERRFLEGAALLHATAESEVLGFRALGLSNPVAVIPPGVNLDFKPLTTIAYPSTEKQKRTLLYLSRIHPKKGLLNLVKAWRQVRPIGWRVVVAGPDEGGHLSEIQAAVFEAGLQGDFEFQPAVSGGAKWELLRSADVFVLPTFSENFGIVVIEALAAGVPVITTKGAPWAELVTRNCGWWVDIGVEPLAAAIKAATTLTDPEREAMGQRGRDLVEENYGWPKIAGNLLEVYQWTVGQGSQPACVMMK